MQPDPRRPDGVTILSISAILGSVALLFAGTAIESGIGTSSSLSPVALALVIVIAFGYVGLGLLTTIPFAVVMLTIAVIYLATGIGFFGGRSWAWRLGIALSLMDVVLSIIQTVELGWILYRMDGVVFGGLFYSIPGLFIMLSILYYLTRPYVRNFFERKTPATPPSSLH
jgi:hypothetical protein